MRNRAPPRLARVRRAWPPDRPVSGAPTGPVSGGGFPNWYNFEDKVQFRNDTSIQAGRHAVKFGVDYARLPKHGGIYGPGSPGNVTFWDDPSTILGNLNGRYPQGFNTPGIVRQWQQANPVRSDDVQYGAKHGVHRIR